MDNPTDLLNAIGNVDTNAAVGLIAGDAHARKVVELTTKITRCDGDNGIPWRVLQNGTIETVERLYANPTFRRGVVTFFEALSFGRFVVRYKSALSVIFADAIERKFTAALDYHPAGGAQKGATWDLFRGVLPLKHTEAWTEWSAVNKKPMEQVDFAQFLEDHIPDIAEPDGAQLVEIARTLEAKTDVQFESHIRAQNGAHRFAYIENVNGTAAGGIEVPQEFTLVLQPFEGSKTYQIKARLRYRIASRKLTLWFDLVRMQDILREAFNDELLKIQEVVGDTVPIFNGPAPTAQEPKA